MSDNSHPSDSSLTYLNSTKTLSSKRENPPIISYSKWLYDIFISYSFHVNFTRFSTLFLFLPLVMQFGNGSMDSTILASSLRDGTLFYDSSIVAVCFIVPLMIDIAIDHCLQQFRKKSNKKKFSKKTKETVVRDFNNVELVHMLLGFVSVPIVAFFPRSTPNLALIYLCCRKYQINMCVMTTFLSWSRSFPEHFSSLSVSCSIVGMAIGQEIQTFYQIASTDHNYSTSSSSTALLYVLFNVCFWPGIALFFISSFRCLYRLFRQMMDNTIDMKETFSTTTLNAPRNKGGQEKEKENMFYPFLYVLSGLVSFLIIFLVFVITGSAMNFTPKYLLINNLVYILLSICILNFCLRRVKYESIKNLYRLIDSKKSYVRYISHELRTPLNSAFLGLKHILDTMRTYSENWTPDDEDTYETLTDVHHSCLTAVDILNDLMCFDKMESGLLELHKENIPVIPFLKECFFSFRAEALERKVKLDFSLVVPPRQPPRREVRRRTLEILTDTLTDVAARASLFSEAEDNDDVPLEAMPLALDDVINVDKFKISQVVRNLASNALKFSPAGSIVTMHAVFVPTKTEDTVVKDIRHSSQQFISRLNSVANALDISRRSSTASVGMYMSGHRKGTIAATNLEQPHSPIVETSEQDLEANDSKTNNNDNGNVTINTTNNVNNFNKNNSKINHNNGKINNNLNNNKRGNDSDEEHALKTLSGVLRITVIDRGVGISSENQKRLFGEIIQFNPEKLQAGGGSGFGLFIAKGITDLHGGDISVFSKGEGSGSKFIVELPMTRTIDNDDRIGTETPSFTPRRSSLLLPPTNRVRQMSSSLPPINDHADSGSGSGSVPLFDHHDDMVPNVNLGGGGVSNGVGRSVGRQSMHMISMTDMGGPSAKRRSIQYTNNHDYISVVKNNSNSNINNKRNQSGDDILVESFKYPVSVKDLSNDTINPIPSFSQTASRLVSPHSFVTPLLPSTMNNGPDSSRTPRMKVTFNTLPSGSSTIPSTPTPTHLNPKSSINVKSDANVAQGSSGKKSYRILVVDDSTMTRKMMLKILRAEGHTCEEAHDGQMAVEKVTKKLAAKDEPFYEAILMDFVMPVLDGPDATRALRDLGCTCPIFGVTGNTLDMDIQRFMDAGATDVYSKPFDAAVFANDMSDLTSIAHMV